MPNETNKRIAKNTIYLYIRMLITMLVTLYTSRLVIITLGLEEFGIYNIIGGIIIFFSFFNTALSSATQRFISFELGKGNVNSLRNIFKTSVTIHFIISFIIICLAETIGLWFINHKLNIPSERIFAANWVYQFSLLTFIVGILRIPFNATIISYEKMSFYAYISIFEVLIKLGIVFLLINSPYDKLISYSFLTLLISILVWVIFFIYCRVYFEICSFKFFWNKLLFIKLFSFSGWSIISGSSVIATQQAGNIFLNIYFGVVSNAAYGIANQVSQAIYGLVSNFQLAFQPQIIKLYAGNDIQELLNLILRASRVSFYLLLIIAVPFYINAELFLKIWLTNVPENAVIFCQWMIVYFLIDAIQGPLWMLVNATGNIKSYTIYTSLLLITNVPLSWIVLAFGSSAASVLIIRVIVNILSAIYRLYYVNQNINFPIYLYFKKVLLNSFIVLCSSVLMSIILKSFLTNTLINSVILTFVSFALTIVSIYLFGLTTDEKKYLKYKINNLYN